MRLNCDVWAAVVVLNVDVLNLVGVVNIAMDTVDMVVHIQVVALLAYQWLRMMEFPVERCVDLMISIVMIQGKNKNQFIIAKKKELVGVFRM